MFVSVGNSRMDKKFNGQEMTYEEFAKRLSQTVYTAETMEQYRKMPKGEQDNVKDVGGFVLGKLKGGRRKKDCVISRSAVTLDMDYGTEGILDEIEMFFDMKMIAYSTLILSRLVDTFSSRILYPMLLLSGNHSIAVV